MDLPDQDEQALRSDLEGLARLNETFGGRKAVETAFHRLADSETGKKEMVLVDLAAGYCDHGRNLLSQAGAPLAIVAVDFQFQTLKIARAATPASKKMFFVQADIRKLPFRDKSADLAFCSLALHHFAEPDALAVLKEMARIGRRGACLRRYRPGPVRDLLHLAADRFYHPRPNGPPRRAPLDPPRFHPWRDEIARASRRMA